jgi:DNA-binding response OmpR family regulator
VDCSCGADAAVAACVDLRRVGFSRAILCIDAQSDGDIAVETAVLEGGADDYVAQPLPLERLAVRVRVLTRRESGTYVQPLRSAGILLDPIAGSLFVNGRRVHLTATEWRLLAALMRREGTCISAEELAATCTSALPAAGDTRKIRVHVSHLATKLQDAGKVIQNVPGRGYVFQPGLDVSAHR